MCLAQGPQRSDASEARTWALGLESSTLPLSHWAPKVIVLERNSSCKMHQSFEIVLEGERNSSLSRVTW